MNNFYLIQIKNTNDKIEKGIVVRDTYEAACQSFHAYLGAYAYGKDINTDYVLVQIVNPDGLAMKTEVWKKAVEESQE